MPTGNIDVEVPVDVPANEMWKVLKDQTDLLPKIIPREVASIELVEGDGDAGSVRIIRYGAVAPEGGYVKERIVKMDAGDRYVVTEEIEGGHLSQDEFSKWVQTLRVIPTGPETSKVHATVQYEGGTDAGADRSKDETKEGLTGTFTAIAKHIKETLMPKANA